MVAYQSHIFDALALSDPLPSRLDTTHKQYFWIGHFPREIPTEYMTTLKEKNLIKNRKIAAFYDKINLITRGDLFDRNRLVKIWNMNMGKYDNLLEDNIFIPPFQKFPAAITREGI